MINRVAVFVVLWVMVLAGLVGGCVRRTLTIETSPPGALVFLNDEEVGRTPVTTDFTWYGDYDVIIRHQNYQTMRDHVQVPQPWYQLPGIDFVAEVLWPGEILDAHAFHFALTERQPPDEAAVLLRAGQLRNEALLEEKKE